MLPKHIKRPVGLYYLLHIKNCENVLLFAMNLIIQDSLVKRVMTVEVLPLNLMKWSTKSIQRPDNKLPKD